MHLFPIVCEGQKNKVKVTECLEAGNSVSTLKTNPESLEILKSAPHRMVEPKLKPHVMSSF